MRRFVQMDSSNVQYLIFLCAFTGAAQNRLYSRYQNLRAERLGNILIHAEIKALQLILFIASRRQHDNRHFGIGPDLPAYLPAVHLRHHHIQNYQRDILMGKKDIQCLASVSCFQYLKIFSL